tara:strand:+ start:733 stop:891 length:159 start_codon:yes stop_codon:yes gene_type:complete
MNNNIIEHLLKIKEKYLKTGDVEQLEKDISDLPPELVELFKEMNQNNEDEKN